MKTSTKILLVSCLTFLATLIVYDLKLNAEYKKGDYTDPFREYKPLNYTGFNEIELNSSTALNMIIVQGPYRVLVSPAATEVLHASQKGKRLIISASFSDHYRALYADYLIYVSCPDLSLLKTDAWYTARGKRVTDTTARDLNFKPTVLKGFVLDSLKLELDHASNLRLINNQIGKLTGVVGTSKNSGPALTLSGDNKLNGSELEIANKGRLVIQGSGTPNLTYHLADSATLVVNGAAIKKHLKVDSL